jgi:hypothetical protein
VSIQTSVLFAFFQYTITSAITCFLVCLWLDMMLCTGTQGGHVGRCDSDTIREG